MVVVGKGGWISFSQFRNDLNLFVREVGGRREGALWEA